MNALDRTMKTDGDMLAYICGSAADADALRDAGIRNVRTIENVEDLFIGGDLDPLIGMCSKFVLAYPHRDAALRDAVAVRLGDELCHWVRWTDDVEGPTEAVRELGPEGLKDFLTSERAPMWIDEVCKLDDIPFEPPQKGYTTGFDKLDEAGIRLVRPAFMVCLGPYGSGKSVLLRQLACNLWRQHGWRTLITSFEEKVRPRYEADLIRHLVNGKNETGVRYSHHRHDPTEEEIAWARDQIKQAFVFLRRPKTELLDADRLIDRIRFAVRVYGVECVIIDPVNEIDHLVPHGMSKTDYIGFFIMRLKQLADDYNLLMIAAAHPPKDGVARRSGPKLYTLNDAADSAHWGNKADIGWCVWRPNGFEDAPTYVNIDKLKDHEVMGKPDLARLTLEASGSFRVTKTGNDVAMEILGGDDQ